MWEQLLSKLKDKDLKLHEALILVQFKRECNEYIFYSHYREAFVSSNEFGQDLEHVEDLICRTWRWRLTRCLGSCRRKAMQTMTPSMTYVTRDLDETNERILENYANLSTDDYGLDLARVQALRHIHGA